MRNLRSVDEWRLQLGFLPVPLFSSSFNGPYVLLNGSKGNFCLDLEECADIQPTEAGKRAWSSDVDHYVSIVGETLRLLRWDRPEEWSESFRLNEVDSRLQLFQKYLESKPAPREKSVVTRAIATYRVIRTRASSGDPQLALMAFLSILAKAWDIQQGNGGTLQCWTDREQADQVTSELLGESGTAMVIDGLLRTDDLTRSSPAIELMIRHASGRIFQEAHYLALVPPQKDLFFTSQVRPLGPASKTLGAFFTPTPLVRTVVEQALAGTDFSTWQSVHVFDPACGSGEFLRESVRQLRLCGYRGHIRVTGYDISLPACLMARFGIAAEVNASAMPVGIDIIQRDALDGTPWVNDVNLCVMNPPFVSWRDMNTGQQDAVAAALAEFHQKRPDMAMAFVRLAVNSISPGGAVGAVLPASFLDGDSSRPLRDFLSSQLSIQLSARLGNQQIFADVTVDAALLVARRAEVTQTHGGLPTLMVWADHQLGSSELALRALRQVKKPFEVACLNDASHFSIYAVPSASLEDHWAPRPYRSAKLLAELSALPTVRSLFSVQQGTITGMNSVYLLSNEEMHRLPKTERRFFRPAVTNRSIVSGHLEKNVWVFYPHGAGLELETEQELASAVKTFYNTRLKPFKEALQGRARIKPLHWWRLSEYRSWQVDFQPKIVSTYFGAAGSFALDKSGEFVVVQGYGWMARKAVLKTDQRCLFALLAILNASVTNELLAGISNNLAGGQWNLSKRFIELMPIPDILKMPSDLQEALAEIGELMTVDVEFDADRLDTLARQALGVDLFRRY